MLVATNELGDDEKEWRDAEGGNDTADDPAAPHGECEKERSDASARNRGEQKPTVTAASDGDK